MCFHRNKQKFPYKEGSMNEGKELNFYFDLLDIDLENQTQKEKLKLKAGDAEKLPSYLPM